MMLLVGNVETEVLRATPDELRWLQELLAVRVRRFDGRRHKYVDTSYRLYRRAGGRVRVLTGIVPTLLDKASKRGLRIEVMDGRELPPVDEAALQALQDHPWAMTGSRGYQYQAVREALHGGPGRLQRPLAGRGIVWAPTGAGKGHIACAIAYSVPGHWVYMVHRGNLADDVAARWDRLTMGLEPPAGYVTQGRWRPGKRFTVATLQTLYANIRKQRFLDLAERTVGIVVDEAHTCPAKTFAAVVRGFERAGYRIGLSGTPLDRTDQRSAYAVGLLGPIVYRVSAEELSDAGVITLPTVRIVPVWHPPSLAALPWSDLYTQAIVDSDHRNGAVLACLAHAKANGNLPAMVFVRKVFHGQQLAVKAQSLGLRVEYIHGKCSAWLREQAIRKLKTGELDAVVSTKVFVEGVDVPNLRAVVNAAGGKSVIECLQQAGRSMRVADGKTGAVVYEIGDKGCRILHRHAQTRLRAYVREGYRYVVDNAIYPERHTPDSQLTLRR